jgi:ferrous iron transport protein B
MDTQTRSPTTLPPADKKTRFVAVAGNPNSGKTTIFNALTGLRHRVGNYSGVTVEKREGQLVGSGSEDIRLIDLPGTYSLSARSPDEEIAREVLLGHLANTPMPDVVLIVSDAGNLERNLFLASQIIDLGLPTVIACNMMDQLDSTRQRLDIERLARYLGIEIVPCVGHRQRGIDELRTSLLRTCQFHPAPRGRRRWQLDSKIQSEVDDVARALEETGHATGPTAEGTAILLLGEAKSRISDTLPEKVQAALRESLRRSETDPHMDISREITRARYDWLAGVVRDCLSEIDPDHVSASDRMDQILTAPFPGLLILSGVMAALFYAIFALAAPVAGLLEELVVMAQRFTEQVLPAGLLSALLSEGVLAGVGNVLVFFPQICILFLFIALLEDSGYMARAAFLLDRFMSRVGLHGKSFIPLLSSHACAVPGILAARTIENPRDRLATILVAPLMSCSARLPVYTVLIAACLPASAIVKALAFLGLYVLGIVTAMLIAALLKKSVLRGAAPGFIMELPPYRIPRPAALLRVVWDRAWLFLSRAGTVILAATIVLWAGMNFPRSEETKAQFEAKRAEVLESQQAEENTEAQLAEIDRQQTAVQLEQSLIGRVGKAIEPTLRPLGYDWKISMAILASFSAREVFVSTLGIAYSMTDDENAPLREQVQQAKRDDGSPAFTPLVAVSLLVFYAFACQCASTLAVVKTETGRWRWPALLFAYMTGLAYVMALLVYQVGSAIGLGA